MSVVDSVCKQSQDVHAVIENKPTGQAFQKKNGYATHY